MRDDLREDAHLLRDLAGRSAPILRWPRSGSEGDARQGAAERALFLFVNKAGNRLKALWWDRTGYCVLYKRLERGVFRFPSAMRAGDTSVAIEAAEFAKILEGLDVPRGASIGVVHRRPAATEEVTAPA